MVRLTYNSQLNTKPVIFKFYTPWEFFIGLMVAFSVIGIPIVAGLSPSFVDTILVFVTYTLFLIYFKIGKPDGYLSHWLSHFFTPMVYRPGHKNPTFPIKPDIVPHMESLARTPRERWDYTRQVQLELLDAGLMPNGSYGNYMRVDESVQASAKQFIMQGGVLSVNNSYTEPN